MTSEEAAEIKRPRAENRQLREDIEILRKGLHSSGARPPQPMIMAFPRTCAARATRTSRPAGAARRVGDAMVIDALLATRGTPEGLDDRRKMTAFRLPAPPRPAGCPLHGRSVDAGPGDERRATRRAAATTISAKDGHRADDLLHRDFTASARNTRCVTDFSHVRTWTGFVYVAFVVACYAQRIVGWHAAASKATDHRPDSAADRDVEPPSPRHPRCCFDQLKRPGPVVRYTAHLALEGIAPSIATVGDAYDNGLMESIIGLYKTEAVATDVFHDGLMKTLVDFDYATAGRVSWCNHRRLQSSIGQIPPAEHEQAYYAALNREPHPV